MKNLRKILAVILSLAMVIGSISTTAFAGMIQIDDEGNNLAVYYYDSEGTQIGDENYGSTEDFRAIFTGAPSGTASFKISPMSDLTDDDITQTLQVIAGEVVTFDLNGFDVTTDMTLFSVGGTNSLPGELTLVNTGEDASITETATSGQGMVCIEQGGQVTVEGIKLNSDKASPVISNNEGTFVAKEADDTVPYINGDISGTGTFKMSAGYYSAAAGAYDSYLDTTQTREGVGTNLQFEQVTNSDATYCSKIVEKPLVAETGSLDYYSIADAITAASTGDEIKLVANVTEDVSSDASVTLDLNGKALTGTITAANMDIKDDAADGSVSGNVVANNISSGTFAGEVNAQIIIGGTFDGAVTATAIKGGKYKTTHVTIADGYADDTPSGGYTEVVEKKVCENETTKTQYSSLQKAIDAASSGDTIKLIEAVNEDASVSATESVVIDTAGLELNGTITNNGTLTITDSVNTSANVTGKITKVVNNKDLSLGGILCIASLENAGEALKIVSDIAGSSIDLKWATLTKSTVATKEETLSVDLSSYIGTVFIESYDTYELVAESNAIYLVSVSIDSVSMTLANELAMNYYCTVPADMLDEMSKKIILEVTCDADPEGTQLIVGTDTLSKKPVTKTDEITGESKTFDQYIFTFDGIDPTWMASDLTARVYLGTGDETSFDSTTAYDSNVYSVAEYINNLYANIEATKTDSNANTNVNIPTDKITAYYSDMESLIADILMYGKTAQVYRSYNTDALATQVTYEYNEGVRTMVKHSADLEWITNNKSSYTPAADGSDNILVRYAKNTNLSNLAVDGSAIEISGATCMFGKGGYIAPRFMVSAKAEDVEAANVAVRITRYASDGTTVLAKRTVALDSSHTWSNYYYVEIGGPDDDLEFQFYPQDFGQKIKVEVLAATNAGTARILQILNYSINSYCCNWISDTSNVNMSNFALATFRYGKSTQALYNDLNN